MSNKNLKKPTYTFEKGKRKIKKLLIATIGAIIVIVLVWGITKYGWAFPFILLIIILAFIRIYSLIPTPPSFKDILPFLKHSIIEHTEYWASPSKRIPFVGYVNEKYFIVNLGKLGEKVRIIIVKPHISYVIHAELQGKIKINWDTSVLKILKFKGGSIKEVLRKALEGLKGRFEFLGKVEMKIGLGSLIFPSPKLENYSIFAKGFILESTMPLHELENAMLYLDNMEHLEALLSSSRSI